MDEAQLDRLLARGSLQLRLNEALRWSCGAVLAAAFVAAAVVLVTRLNPSSASGFLSGLWLLLVLVLAAAVVGFVRCRPALRDVALQLDRVAALQEHLSTWEEIRRRGLPQESVARSFALLQRAATLRVAKGLRPGHLLPLVLPGWSRALWLALLLLGCAVLMPEQRAAFGRMSVAGVDDDGGSGVGAAGAKPVVATRLTQTFNRIVDVLNPADKQKLAIACSADVPEIYKADVLGEMERKLGGLSATELSPEVRELLAELKRQVRGADDGNAKPGSATVAGNPAAGSSSTARPDGGANVLTAQQALALAREHFPDVAEALQRYYLAK